jgi:hypothetical protein
MLVDLCGGPKDRERYSLFGWRERFLIPARIAYPSITSEAPVSLLSRPGIGEYRRTDDVLDDGAHVFVWKGWR